MTTPSFLFDVTQQEPLPDLQKQASPTPIIIDAAMQQQIDTIFCQTTLALQELAEQHYDKTTQALDEATIHLLQFAPALPLSKKLTHLQSLATECLAIADTHLQTENVRLKSESMQKIAHLFAITQETLLFSFIDSQLSFNLDAYVEDLQTNLHQRPLYWAKK